LSDSDRPAARAAQQSGQPRRRVQEPRRRRGAPLVLDQEPLPCLLGDDRLVRRREVLALDVQLPAANPVRM
jgi:hypothetical protein